MKEYDVIVIGSGSGMSIVNNALGRNLKVALVEKDHLGGTCLNVGCIPSKMLVYPADLVARIRNAKKLGVNASVSVNFSKIMNHMRSSVKESREHMRRGIRNIKNLDFYNVKAEFIHDYTLRVGGREIKGKKIIIASGARPSVPPIEGIENVIFLTNESVLELKKLPLSIIIIGGGYVGCEYAHFFASMGSKVTVVQRNEFLVPNEEPEVSRFLMEVMKKRVKVFNNTEASKISSSRSGYMIECRNKKSGRVIKLNAQEVMIAAGRKSNADLLKVQKSGVETDEKGFIKVNDFFETSKPNIWAFGDAIGRQMFKHAANDEAELVWINAFEGHKHAFDFSKVPHAVFSYPQIASIGLKEKEARKKFKNVLVGTAKYSSVAKGNAMMEEGFAKAIVNKDDDKILGFHIIGSFAPILIQEIINTMANNLPFTSLFKGMHIHPAMPEITLSAFSKLKPVKKIKNK